MKQLVQYFLLELKKTFLQLPALLAGSVLLLVITFSCIFFIQSSSPAAEKNPPVFVGVLAEKEEPFIDWIIKTANHMPDMGYSVRIERIDKKTAQNHFFDEETNVLFIIPKNYISSILHGENKPVTIRFSKTQTTVVNTLIKELAGAASSFILNTEAAMYSMHDYYQKYHLPNETKDDLSLNMTYVKEIVGFSKTMHFETPENTQNISLAASCLSAGLVLLPLLFCLLPAPVITSESSSLKKELARMGIRLWQQTLVKELVFFLTIFTSFLGIAILCFLMQKMTFLPFSSFLGNTFPSEMIFTQQYGIFFLLFCLAPVFFLAASFALLLYELSGEASGGMMLLFFSIIFMALFSGLFYPVRYLPELFQNVSEFLPIRYAQDYILELFYQQPAGKHAIILLLYSICFYFLAVLENHRKDKLS